MARWCSFLLWGTVPSLETRGLGTAVKMRRAEEEGEEEEGRAHRRSCTQSSPSSQNSGEEAHFCC